MVDWLTEIGNMIASICQFFINFVSSLGQAIVVLTNASTAPVIMIPWMPIIIGTSITSVVAIAVLKLIVGWGNS